VLRGSANASAEWDDSYYQQFGDFLEPMCADSVHFTVPGSTTTPLTSPERVSQKSKAQLDYKEMDMYESFNNYPEEGYACLDDHFAHSKEKIQQLSMAFGKNFNSITQQEQANWSFIGRLLFSSTGPPTITNPSSRC